MVDLRDRVAVVTGATAGLGRVCCQHLAREGMRLALVARRASALEALAEELRPEGAVAGEPPMYLPVPADVTRQGDVEAMVEQVDAKLGPPYLLVNAMNIERLLGGPFVESSLAQFEMALSAKPRGYYLTMRALLPGMLARQQGCVINIASGAGVSGSAGFALFSASEFAIVGLTDSVAREVQERGVHVCALCPWGIIDSERVRRMFPDRDPMSFMDPEDLAETIVYLAKRSQRAWVRQVIVRSPSAID